MRYTDASCLLPNDPTRRTATFAAILDHANDDYTVATVGLVPGRQTISRAELVAVVCILRHIIHTIIYTDSQHVFDLVQEFTTSDTSLASQL